MKELKLFNSFQDLKSCDETYPISEDQIKNCILELEDFCFQLQNTSQLNKLSSSVIEPQQDGE